MGDFRKRILVADDDPAMRAVLETYLLGEGYEVLPSASGGDLLWAVESMSLQGWPADTADLLITDVRMPGVSGLEVVSWLRAARWAMPIILMTAFPEDAVATAATRFGVRLLAKPFSLTHFGEVVGEAMASALGPTTPVHVTAASRPR